MEISLAVRVLVALVFLTAAWGKLRERLVFQGVIANYRLLPEALVAPTALALPPLEALVGLTLPVDILAPWPEAVAAALLLLFAVAMAINIRRGRRHIDCGCFQSTLKQTLSWTLVARNLGLAAMLLGSLVPASGPVPVWGMAEAVLAGGTAFFLLQSLNILWSVVPAWRQPHAHHGGAGK